MSQAKINQTLIDHLRTLPFSPELPLDAVDQETPYKPTIGQAYVEATILVNETGTLSIGSGKKQFVGIYQITVVSPRSEGTIPATVLADVVVDHFKKDTILDGDGVRVRVNRHPSQATPTSDGSWVRVPVSVPYHCMA